MIYNWLCTQYVKEGTKMSKLVYGKNGQVFLTMKKKKGKQ